MIETTTGYSIARKDDLRSPDDTERENVNVVPLVLGTPEIAAGQPLKGLGYSAKWTMLPAR